MALAWGAVSRWAPKLQPRVALKPANSCVWLALKLMKDAGGVVRWHRGEGSGTRGAVTQGVTSQICPVPGSVRACYGFD